MKPILFLCTMTDKLPNGQPTGLWLSELTDPIAVIEAAGYEWDIATYGAKIVPVDRASGVSSNQLSAFLLCPENFTDKDPSQYAAIFCCGGHGAMFDFPNLCAWALEFPKVAAVCHGVAILALHATVHSSAKEVSCFTKQEENLSGIKDQMPFCLEDRLLSNGFVVRKAVPWQPCVTVSAELLLAKTRHQPEGSRKRWYGS